LFNLRVFIGGVTSELDTASQMHLFTQLFSVLHQQDSLNMSETKSRRHSVALTSDNQSQRPIVYSLSQQDTSLPHDLSSLLSVAEKTQDKGSSVQDLKSTITITSAMGSRNKDNYNQRKIPIAPTSQKVVYATHWTDQSSGDPFGDILG